jgi:hypothetical protein
MIAKNIATGFTAIALLTVAAFVAGCTQTPAKAPGSNPEDMTAEGHRAAAQQEEQQAAQHEQDKANVGPSKPNAEENQKAAHEQQAEQHRDYAQQHSAAAQAVEQK